jgi:hypothetical protein
MTMLDAERTFWERMLEAPPELRGSESRVANNRICGICEGLLKLSNPTITKTAVTLLGHDSDCLSLVWAAQLDFTIVGGGGAGGPLFGSTEPVFGSILPVFGDN